FARAHSRSGSFVLRRRRRSGVPRRPVASSAHVYAGAGAADTNCRGSGDDCGDGIRGRPDTAVADTVIRTPVARVPGALACSVARALPPAASALLPTRLTRNAHN